MAIIDLYDTPEKKAKVIDDLTNLMNQPGWLLLTDIVTGFIEEFKNIVIEGSTSTMEFEEESMQTINRTRDQIKAYQNVINIPKNMIERLRPEEKPQDDKSDDPYE